MGAGPATPGQVASLRRLAANEAIGPKGQAWAEAEIARGLTDDEAYALIGKLGKRIADWRVAHGLLRWHRD